MRNAIVLALALLLLGQAFAQSFGESLENPESYQGRTSVLRDVASNWKVISVALLLLSVGIVALAFALSQAFNLPDLKAWADVELGELFTSALIIIFIVALFVFIDAFASGMAQGDANFASICSAAPDEPCSIQIAGSYLQSYIKAANQLYEDISIRRIEVAQDAYKTHGIMGSYMMYFYGGFNFREPNVGRNMIEMETYDQLLQFLSTMIGALHTQSFIMYGVSRVIAPLVLLLGIVLRSFFLTRRLGGLMMAFGIGFMLVYPATYALAYFTIKSAVYGVNTEAGSGTINICPEACRKNPPTFYSDIYPNYDFSKGYYDIIEPRQFTTSEAEEYLKELNDGRIAGGSTGVGYYPDRFYPVDNETIEGFMNGTDPYGSLFYTDEEGAVRQMFSCGAYSNFSISYQDEDTGRWMLRTENCPKQCREIPYPHWVQGCTDQERFCSEMYKQAPGCFTYREYNESDPALAEVDKPTEVDACPLDCRVKAPGGIIPSESSLSSGYLTGVYDYLRNCPAQCRWITTSGKMDPNCPLSEEYNDFECGRYTLTAAEALAEWNSEDLNRENYLYIIPDIVFSNPKYCEPCTYVMDRGLTYKPNQIYTNCVSMCGTAGSDTYSYEDPATTMNNAEGFVGTTEIKSVSKLAIPALVLPLFGLALTFMFIQVLSPMLGGDIDIPGMMRML